MDTRVEDLAYHKNVQLNKKWLKRGGADVPLFETIKTNAGTQPKNELQQ